jgi:hypothetical protein
MVTVFCSSLRNRHTVPVVTLPYTVRIFLPSSVLRNLTELYLPLCDTWIIYDNSGLEPLLVPERSANGQLIIYQSEIWEQITEVTND